MQHLLKHHKWIVFFVILLIALGVTAPVLADYLGPNRTVPNSNCKVVLHECRWVEAKQDYRYHDTKSWSCQSESKEWQNYPSNSRSCNAANVGYEYWSREGDETTDYPPATIEGSLQNCTLHGEWCNSATTPVLALSAKEPVQGYFITQIEGELNGEDFACQPGATSCTIPLKEGQNNLAYWAHSSWGDTSEKGEMIVNVDTGAPSVSLDIQGTPGANNWWGSVITVTATGNDAMPGSGVASARLSLDGGTTWQSSVTLTEGVYNIMMTVYDNAGNVSTSTTTLMVDMTKPSIDLSVTGTLGNNNWYKSAIQVTGEPKDATSGVATLEASADGAVYQAYTAPLSFGDGHHTVRFKAVDQAGNVTETPVQDFYIDTQAPTVDLPRSWPFDKNVDYTAQDNMSGLAALRVVIEDEDEKFAKVTWDEPVSGMATFSDNIHWNGVFKDKKVAPPGTYLVWIKASDRAGNERFQLGKVTVPEPNYAWILPQPNAVPPTEEAVVPSPVPPAELTEPESLLPVTSPPTTFGGGTTQPGEGTKQSLLLAMGTVGTSSGNPWGAAAAAAIGAATAYAVDATRKGKKAKAKAQAARARQHLTKEEKKEQKAKQAEAHDEKVQDRRERQAWENPAQEKAKLKERERAYQEWLQQQKNLPPPMPTGISPDAQQAFLHGGPSAQGWITANAQQLQQKKQEPPVPPMPTGISPEAQQAFMHGGASAQGWINRNTPQLQQAYAKQREEEARRANAPIITAAPPACVAVPEKPWWKKVGDWVSPKASYVIDAVVAATTALKVKDVKFTQLPSGMVSVSAKNLPPGTRADYFKNVVETTDYAGLKPGGNYNPETVASRVKNGALTVSKSTWITAGLVSLGVNLYQYGKDATSLSDFSDKTLENRKFWVSTGVDTVLSVAVGVAAATIATAAVALVAGATAPVVATVVVAAVIGFGIGWGLSKLGVPNLIKDTINAGMDKVGL